MNDINRRSFIAELEKLLSFMYDEDKETALGLYETLFDSADNEQELISSLLSPTRQAVLLARAYDAKERKIALADKNSEKETPDFYSVICDAAGEYFGADAEDLVFGDISAKEFPVTDAPQSIDTEDDADDAKVYHKSDFAHRNFIRRKKDPEKSDPVRSVVSEESSPLESGSRYADEPEKSAADDEPESDSFDFQIPPEAKIFMEDAADDTPEEESHAHAEDTPPEENSPDVPERPVVVLIKNSPDPEVSSDDEANPASQSAEAGAASDTVARNSDPVRSNNMPLYEVRRDETSRFDVSSVPFAPEYDTYQAASVSFPQEKKGQLKTGILILFLIAAIPITAILIVLLLFPALFCLALSVFSAVLGVKLLISAFGGFAVFADIMVVLGTGLVLIALGVLFFWIFIWFIGSVITGLINGVINLGSRVCYKEVAEA